MVRKLVFLCIQVSFIATSVLSSSELSLLLRFRRPLTNHESLEVVTLISADAWRRVREKGSSGLGA